MAHDDPDDRGRRRAAPHTPETAGLERLRSWACLDADSVPHACPNFSDTVVLAANDSIPSHLAQPYDQGVSRAGRCCIDQCCDLRVSPTGIHGAGTETVEPVPVPVRAPNPR